MDSENIKPLEVANHNLVFFFVIFQSVLCNDIVWLIVYIFRVLKTLMKNILKAIFDDLDAGLISICVGRSRPAGYELDEFVQLIAACVSCGAGYVTSRLSSGARSALGVEGGA